VRLLFPPCPSINVGSRLRARPSTLSRLGAAVVHANLRDAVGEAGASRRTLPRSRFLRACLPRCNTRNVAVRRERQDCAQIESGGRRVGAPLFRRCDRRASRPYTAVVIDASIVAAASAGAQRRRRRARRTRALTPRRAARPDDRGPRPWRGAVQDARTIQEGPSPRRQPQERPTKHDSTSGVRGRRRSRCPVGGAAAPAARRASRDSRGHCASSRACPAPRNACAIHREPREPCIAKRAGPAPRDNAAGREHKKGAAEPRRPEQRHPKQESANVRSVRTRRARRQAF